MAWRSERRDSFTCSSQRLPGSPCLRLSPRHASASLYMGNVRPREADDSSIYRYTRIRCSACNTSSTSILPLFTASATRSRSHDARRQAWMDACRCCRSGHDPQERPPLPATQDGYYGIVRAPAPCHRVCDSIAIAATPFFAPPLPPYQRDQMLQY